MRKKFFSMKSWEQKKLPTTRMVQLTETRLPRQVCSGMPSLYHLILVVLCVELHMKRVLRSYILTAVLVHQILGSEACIYRNHLSIWSCSGQMR